MVLESLPESHAGAILEVLEGLESSNRRESFGVVEVKLEEYLPDSIDFSGEELLEFLVREDLAEFDSEEKLESVDLVGIRNLAGLPEPYKPPEDPAKSELALDFAKWLKREEELLPVLMDLNHSSRKAQIYEFDTEERIWEKRGNFEKVVTDRIGNELPEKNGNGFKKRVRNSLFGQWNERFSQMGLEGRKLAVQDGLLDFSTGTIREIEREDRVLNRLPVSHSEMPEECPEEWIGFLEEATEDEDAIKTLQEFVGYSLMHWTRKYGKMLMLLGPTRTGKSTFLRVVEELLGGDDNVSNQPLEDLCSDGSAGRWSPKHLEGKLANIHPDLDGDRIERPGRAKNLTEDGESINAEIKGVSQYEIEPNAKHMYAANSPPSTSKREDAFFDRFLTVRFENQVPREEQDEDLVDRLTEQENLNGIFKWALDGMKRLQEQGEFTRELKPLATKELFSMYESGPKAFVHEVCDFKHKASKEEREANDWKISTERLHSMYEEWARGRGIYKLCGEQRFSSQVRDLPNVGSARPRDEAGNQRRGYSGIRLKDEAILSRMEDSGGSEPGE